MIAEAQNLLILTSLLVTLVIYVIIIIIISAKDAVVWRGYCGHFVTMYVCMRVYNVSAIRRKPLIAMT